MCTILNREGEAHVFRSLHPNPDETAIQRFKRELKILNSIDHPNVVKLVEFSESAPYWYITREGKTLKEYWRSQIGAFKDDSEALTTRALSLVQGLALGLQACHEKHLVHRDIKPDNIVIYDDMPSSPLPVIIDFGIVWVPSEDRLTQPNEPVGNHQFSPDVQRYPNEPREPWQDVFTLLQVFQWMIVSRGSERTWSRPLHWRYIEYPQTYPAWFIEGLRALGAIASLKETCPVDGGTLYYVINKLFAVEPTSLSKQRMLPTKEMAVAIAEGERERSLRTTQDQEALNACWEIARIQLQRIKGHLLALAGNGLAEIALDTFLEESRSTDFQCCVLRCRPNQQAPDRSFEISMTVRAFVPSLWPNGDKPENLKISNTFACYLERRCNLSSQVRKFPYREVNLTMGLDGEFYEVDRSWRERLRRLTDSDIESLISNLFTDPEAWKFITSI